MRNLLFGLVALLLSTAAFALVNVNTASREELVALNGIGPSKAQAIIDHRTNNGPFKSVDDVRKVKGIGEKLFLQIKPDLTVSGARVAAAPSAAAVPGAPAATGKADAKPSRIEGGKNGR